MRAYFKAIVGLIVLGVLGILVAGTRSQTQASQKAADNHWDHVQVVAYASGLTGFFDERTGKLYLYDSNLDRPFIIREVEELGKPLKKLQN